MTEGFPNGILPKRPDRCRWGRLARIAMNWRVRSKREAIPSQEAGSEMSSIVVCEFGQKVYLQVEAAVIEDHKSFATKFWKGLERIHDGAIVGDGRLGTIDVMNWDGSVDGG